MKARSRGFGLEDGRLSSFRPPDLVYVATVRAPSGPGAIQSIHSPHLPRDYRFITAEDIPGQAAMEFPGDKVPILAKGRVDYPGQPVGLIAGPDRGRVDEAVRLTKVLVDAAPEDGGLDCFGSGRLKARAQRSTGDVDRALAEAATVVKASYRLGAVDHYYPEPQGAAAYYDYDRLVILSSTQWPSQVRRAIASALAVDQSAVTVLSGFLGPHLDGKLWYPSLLACHAALVAFILGKPAMLQLSRDEDFLYTPKRAPLLASYRAGMDEDGRLCALDASLAVNIGAHGPLAAAIVDTLAASFTGPYSCPAVRADVWAVASDRPPMGAWAGLGLSSATYGLERLADACSRASGADPLAFRLLNVSQKGDTTSGVALKQVPRLKGVSERLLELSDYRRKRSAYELIRKRRPDPSLPPGFGVGLAFAYQSNDLLPAFGNLKALAVEAELDKDGFLTIRAPILPTDSSALGVWRNEAAAIIGIDPKAVRVERDAGADSPDAGPAAFSNAMNTVARLVGDACSDIRDRRFREALPLVARKVNRKSGRKSSPLDGASWAGAVVELTLDPLDGRPRVKGVWLSLDAGRVLSPVKARLSLERDAARALSTCLGERFDPDHAGPASIRAYRISRLDDTPPIVVDFLDTGDARPGGLGELAFSCVPAAFANALSQASDSADSEETA
ncbi:MAG: xanthine dehydrogenase family protein [Spirochaetales bacterium]|nr:xanthine dehydrogenase family protein [Spirochaetales bacterium]